MINRPNINSAVGTAQSILVNNANQMGNMTIRFNYTDGTPTSATSQEEIRRSRAELRAWIIVCRLLDTLGFVKTWNGTCYNWGIYYIKKDAWGLVNENISLIISDRGDVYIRDKYICLVEQDPQSHRVYGDFIASRIMALCTKARKKISTLKDYQRELDLMLPLDKVRPKLVQVIKEVHDV